MSKKLNLLFIFTDEQAANTMKAYGNSQIHTPNMNKLASKSIIFKNAYVTQPVCTPSRATLMTGLYPHTNGCWENNLPLSAEIPCLPEMGNFIDYKTGYIGKWHLGDEIFAQHSFETWKSIEDNYQNYYGDMRDKMAHCSYTEFLLEKGYETDVVKPDGFKTFSRQFCARLPEKHGKAAYVAYEACSFIEENKENPFILFVNFLEPHMPFHSPRDAQYDRNEIPLPENFYHELTKDQPLKLHLLQQAYYENGYEGKPLKTEEDWKDIIARYWGLVSLVDDQLGKILDTLEQCGLWEDTIIVYTSDHGDMMGSHRLLAKCVMYEEAIKVPLLLKIPQIEYNGRLIENPVSQVDLMPTLLEAMGQTPQVHLEGFSWIPFLAGGGELHEKDVFVEWNGGNNGCGADAPGQVDIVECWRETRADDEIVRVMQTPVRTVITPDGWKYNWSFDKVDELYNLKIDPLEKENLTDRPEYSELIKDLRGKIRRWQMRTGDKVKFGEEV